MSDIVGSGGSFVNNKFFVLFIKGNNLGKP